MKGLVSFTVIITGNELEQRARCSRALFDNELFTNLKHFSITISPKLLLRTLSDFSLSNPYWMEPLDIMSQSTSSRVILLADN